MPTSEAGRLIGDQLRVLRESYAKNLPAKLDQLAGLWRTLRAQDHPDPATLEALRMETHRLAGSGASYGYTRLSGLMQSIEQKLDQWRDFPEDAASMVVEVDRLLALLPAYSQPDDDLDTDRLVEAAQVVGGQRRSRGEQLSVVLLAEAEPAAFELQKTLRQYGFDVRLVHEERDVVAGDNRELDLLLVTHNCFRPAWLNELRQTLNTLPYIIMLTPHPTLLQRVALYRKGVMKVLGWPVDSTLLISEIESDFGQIGEVPYRVLLVDDDVELGLYYGQVLSSAGMLTRIASDPEDVESALESFRPDVIVMDLYMPEVNGIELANAIRQDPACFGVPIIFASVEKDIVRHIGPIRAGGDDFLVKPVPVPFLIASVEARARRGRELRRMVNRDGLTGLLNHVALEENLQREVARAERQESPLALAMIDLDQFKKINDTYGHLMGDRVLIDFAHLLRNRLRRSDIIGRYGGEEFAIILPDTELDEAVRLVDELREAFSQVCHRLGRQQVQVTFSAGVAPWLPGLDTDLLRQQADSTLYAAKRSGRNRVCVHRPA